MTKNGKKQNKQKNRKKRKKNRKNDKKMKKGQLFNKCRRTRIAQQQDRH